MTIEQEYKKHKFGISNIPYNSNSALNPATKNGKIGKQAASIAGTIGGAVANSASGTSFNPISWAADKATSILPRDKFNQELDQNQGASTFYSGFKSVTSSVIPFWGAALNIGEAVGSAFL